MNQTESTLSAIFEEKKVRRDVQATLTKLEVRDCETFAIFEGSSDKLRGWLHSADIGLERIGPDSPSGETWLLHGRRQSAGPPRSVGSKQSKGQPVFSSNPWRHVRHHAESVGSEHGKRVHH